MSSVSKQIKHKLRFVFSSKSLVSFAISLGLTNKSLANKAMLTLKDSKLTIGANTEWGSVPYIGKVGKRHGATNADGELYKLMWVK